MASVTDAIPPNGFSSTARKTHLVGGKGRAMSAQPNSFEPITPNDSTDLVGGPATLYVVSGGNLEVIGSAEGEVARIIPVTDFQVLPFEVIRVRAAGTTASGIWALRTKA